LAKAHTRHGAATVSTASKHPLGTTFKLDFNHRVDASPSWFFAVRALSLQHAANEASPLLRSKANLSLGAGLVWTPRRSQRTVTGND
jgi:hypothetical protein